MEHTPVFASRRPALGRSAIVVTETMAREAGRLLTHAVEVAMPEDGYRPTTLEVSYALSGQLRVPRLDIRVTRRDSENFLAGFQMAPARDRAVGRGYIDIGGSRLPIRPWCSAGGTVENVWWYHAKVTLERVPMEAWNEDGVQLILGDACILDRLDSHSVLEVREQSEFLTCWVWMEDPDDLPRSVEYVLFPKGAGRAFDVNGLPSPTRIPSSPPVGKKGEPAILVHLAGYEDWRPRSPDVGSSGTSSESWSSAPVWTPFTWASGVLDGRPSNTRALYDAACSPPVPPQDRRDRDLEDDSRGPHRQPGELRSYRVRQLFPGCASGRSVRICS